MLIEMTNESKTCRIVFESVIDVWSSLGLSKEAQGEIFPDFVARAHG